MEPSNDGDIPLSEGLEALLEERGMSIRELARRTGTTPSHLSRVLREVDGKRSSASLARRVAVALELPVDHFAEARIETILDRLRADPRLRGEVYRMVSRIGRSQKE